MIKKHVALSLALFTAGAIYLGSATDTQAHTTKQKHTHKCYVKKHKKVCSTVYTKKVAKKGVSKKSLKRDAYVKPKKSFKKASAKRNVYVAKKSTKRNAYVAPKKAVKRNIDKKQAQYHAIPTASGGTIGVAKAYVGSSERGSRGRLMGLFNFAFDHKIDPARTPWCAAFANAVLKKSGKKGTGSLAAKSFVSWGKKTHAPKNGDVVVLKPGSRYHVGFYMGTVKRNGRTYIAVLGGNQSNQVKVSYYPASKVVAYRTA